MPRFQIYRGKKGEPVAAPGQTLTSGPRFACQRAIVDADGKSPPGEFGDRYEPVAQLFEVNATLEKAARQGHLDKVGDAFVCATWKEANEKAAALLAPPATKPARAAFAAGGEK